MELKYTVHLDDYHSNITAFGVRSYAFAQDQVEGERANGYDVTNVTLDGKPIFCARVIPASGQVCGNRISEPTGAHPNTGECITCEHFRAYQKASAEGRYQGD